jgi:hypothetical protein
MKREELYRNNYHSITEFKDRIEKYMQFYNDKRPHSTLNYKTPNKREKLFYERNPEKSN